ncbi:MAG: hypothetical protein Q4C87_00630 [Actinomycetaceae bacterium]|nr:hypothetical protein [Actinomycetaceae bacterium]
MNPNPRLPHLPTTLSAGHPHRSYRRLCALAAAIALATAGCAQAGGAQSGAGPASGANPSQSGVATQSGGPQSAAQSGASATADGHGHIEGAQEVEEAPVALVTLDKNGALALVDLVSLEATPLATAGGATTLRTDDRFIAATDAEGTTTLVDSGRWTWDHGDHQHYYLAPSRTIGTLPIKGVPTLASSTTRTVVAADKTALVLDREKLGEGTLAEVSRIDIDAGAWAGPIAGHIATVKNGKALLLKEDGTDSGAAPVDCAEARGGALTRAGLVLGCRGGVVIAAEPTDEKTPPSLTWLPLPEGTDAASSPIAFHTRPRRPLLVASNEGGAMWLLDVRKKEWTSLPNPAGIPHATTVDDRHDTTIGVAGDGSVHVWSDAQEKTTTEAGQASPTIPSAGVPVSTNRAWVGAADGQSIIEFDPADGARVARTIPAKDLVDFVEVGL